MSTLENIIDKKGILEEDNPIIVNDQKSDAVRLQILKAIQEVSKEQNLTDKELNYLVEVIDKIYSERKARFFFENRIDNMSRLLSSLLRFISVVPKPGEETTKLYYYNSTKDYLKNEW